MIEAFPLTQTEWIATEALGVRILARALELAVLHRRPPAQVADLMSLAQAAMNEAGGCVVNARDGGPPETDELITAIASSLLRKTLGALLAEARQGGN